MTDPQSDNPTPEVAMGEVTQADRDFAAEWIIIAPGNAKMVRAGTWDHHHAVQAAVRHRLAAIQSAPLPVVEPVAWQWERRGRWGTIKGKWEKVLTPYAPDTWPEADRRNIIPLYAAPATGGTFADGVEGEIAENIRARLIGLTVHSRDTCWPW